ncbi:MAG: 30S ribosomal protein S15 [Pelagibacteraceae bacterium TMED124]|nr:30S ribosomal protein S15 [Candidatus Neomarinimicrobiota bacterium]RPG17354.1 MAG: 30S ribosomal protein S15 [Pelagibacteraceae bacterium TMED124]|tara:strand:- start:782 stop:1015 length:234 start_codon:yes stop_codon:yes gene_type:complete
MVDSKNKNSAGDSKSQITIFTNRIKYLTDHLKRNKKDHSARRGLVDLVSKRKKMLTYLKRNDVSGYDLLIKELGIRK